MNLRTLLVPITAALLLVSTVAVAAPQLQGKRMTIGADDVQGYLDDSFPRSQSALGGLLSLTVSQPKLALPAGSRLQLGFDLGVATAGGSAVPVGNVMLSSALRYDTSTRGFHLEQPTIEDFRGATAGAELDGSTRALLNSFLADYARREPIYRIDPSMAALLGALQVESVGIENGRIAVQFNQDLKRLIPQSLLQR